MKEIQMFLIPAPGAKPEFLATLVPVIVDDANKQQLLEKTWNHCPEKVVLEGYTRDGWAWKPSTTKEAGFSGVRVKSVDGRNKLKGFVKYLADRQKSAYGRFPTRGGGSGCGVWAVSYIQSNTKEGDRMDCRICLDMTRIKDCPLKPLASKPAPHHQQQQQQQQPPQQPKRQQPPTQLHKPPSSAAAAAVAAPSAQPAVRKKKGGFGLLGQLVGAQQQTNRHMEATSKQKAKAEAAAAAAAAGDSGDASATAAADGAPGGAPSALRTAQQVLSEFRQSMQDKMLDFDIAEDQEVLKVSVSLAEHQAGLSTEDKEKVTMDILKYMVYEAAEEVNEEWVAFKEPSEFMDEANFSVYKEGAAPPEVLDEINQGELPDEVRAEQRAIANERQRQVQQAESRNQKKVMREAHQKLDDEDEDVEALNAVKRDRRTIEDYEREKAAKRSRS